MVRFTVDNRNRLIFYGNPVGYVKADTAVVDEMFRTDELNQYLSRMNLTPRWEDGIFDRLVSGEVTGEEPAQSRKGCRIWQLKKDVDVAMRFIGYEDQVRKFGEPDAGNYTLVFDGDLGTSDLERIYTICRDAPPPGYQGYRMALSDVVELYDDFYGDKPLFLADMLTQEMRYNTLMDQLDELEESGRVHCIRPNDPITIGRFEGDENKLLDLYNRGHRESREALDTLQAYLEKA